MPKTPDEIKKGLECCISDSCNDCPYVDEPTERYCKLTRTKDSLVLIQQLQAENAEKDARIKQLEAERTELLNLLEQFGQCVVCEHTDKGTNESPCCDCWLCNGDAECSKWQWRGVQKEE
jgi:hypothetical protein